MKNKLLIGLATIALILIIGRPIGSWVAFEIQKYRWSLERQQLRVDQQQARAQEEQARAAEAQIQRQEMLETFRETPQARMAALHRSYVRSWQAALDERERSGNRLAWENEINEIRPAFRRDIRNVVNENFEFAELLGRVTRIGTFMGISLEIEIEIPDEIGENLLMVNPGEILAGGFRTREVGLITDRQSELARTIAGLRVGQQVRVSGNFLPGPSLRHYSGDRTRLDMEENPRGQMKLRVRYTIIEPL